MLKFDLIIRTLRKNKIAFLIIASLIVAIITYLLVMPAFTLEKEEAEKKGGIEVSDASSELTYTSDDYKVRCTLSGSEDFDAASEADEKDPDVKESSKDEEKKDKDGKDADAAGGSVDLDVKELTKKDDGYSSYVKRAEQAVAKELSKEDSNMKIKGSSVYDISLIKDGEETEPEDPVKVTFEYDKIKKMSEADDVRIVHFAVIDGKEKVEVLAPGDVNVSEKNGSIRSIDFRADSFSVYAIVYTVDFHYEADGETYDFSLEGGSSISLKSLLKKIKVFDDEEVTADEFMKDIAKVESSDESLIDIRKEGEDYNLISLKPFDTEETLTVTMNNGDTFTIIVTDAKDDAQHNADGTVNTITNPAGTTFDLFNYYVDASTKNLADRYQWPGHVANDGQSGNKFDFNWYNFDGTYAASASDGWNRHDDYWRSQHLLGYGNNMGINEGHSFKFTPAMAGTVIDGTKGIKSVDGDAGGVNSWTKDADPRIITDRSGRHYQSGIVQGTLDGGYPKLTNNNTLGTDGESLSYLFDDSNHNGKERYDGVDKLLYVDKDGYYTYDSRDFKAKYQESTNSFIVSDQPDSTDTELKGFWPFGDQVFWCGLHMNTQFSIPVDGKVLNPKDELKDMQFEFSGDDDTWLYIDGVLVGDGGGIHNRTEIDINFAQGTVLLTGKKDTVHTGSFEETRYLDDIFKAAGRYNEDEWEDIPGSSHKRFKAGTYHTFDMFYLERGGGESNLYIHYNLVSTADFTGHKSYEGFGKDERMERNQFHFELIGLDGQYESVWNPSTKTATVTKLNDDKHAIMPQGGTAGGAGTVESPKKEHKGNAWNGKPGTVYTTGVTEDGNINFGNADISQEEMHNCDEGHPSQYRYIVREVVPDDALNADGIAWEDADEDTRKAGGFVKDSVQYDGKIYYMTCTVMSWKQHGSDGREYTRYGLRKEYYTDDTFTTKVENTTFIDFRNRYSPVTGKVDFDKLNAEKQPVSGAEFTLYTDAACTTVAKDINGRDLVATSSSSGKVSFDDIICGTYYMKETKVPSGSGYILDDTVYKVTVVDKRDTKRSSKIVVNGDHSNTPLAEINNLKPGELSVQKKWVDQDGKEADPGNRTARVKIQRKRVGKVLNFTIKIQDRPQYVYTYTTGFSGNTVVADWWDTNQTISSITVKDHNGGSKNYRQDNYWDETNHKNRKITVQNVSGSLDITVVYPADVEWLFTSEHTPWMKDIAVQNKTDAIKEEDTAFNNSTEASHYATLAAPNYVKKWTLGSGKDFPLSDGNGGSYLYYIIEVDENGNEIAEGVETDQGYKLVGYSENNTEGVGDQGVLTVTNEVTAPTTVDITLEKYDINDLDKQSASKLGGATFKLEKYTDATFREADTTWPAQTKADTAGTGTFSFTEVREGYYKLIETNCPDGYIKTGDDPRIKISVSQGQAVITLLDKNGHEISGSQSDNIRITNSTIKYGNTPGAELPMSGGCGTHLIYLLGAVLAIGCAVMLIARKRCE